MEKRSYAIAANACYHKLLKDFVTVGSHCVLLFLRWSPVGKPCSNRLCLLLSFSSLRPDRSAHSAGYDLIFFADINTLTQSQTSYTAAIIQVLQPACCVYISKSYCCVQMWIFSLSFGSETVSLAQISTGFVWLYKALMNCSKTSEVPRDIIRKQNW